MESDSSSLVRGEGTLEELMRERIRATIEAIVDEAEQFVSDTTKRERTTEEVGEMIMSRLKKLDKVAYVRFASVYLDFKDVKEFMAELKGLLRDRPLK